jgi:hypothetical protein
MAIGMPGGIRINANFTVDVVDDRGSSVATPDVVQPARGVMVMKARTTVEYWFADWSGDEDVLTLSDRYLTEIRAIVDEGRQKGYLTRG